MLAWWILDCQAFDIIFLSHTLCVLFSSSPWPTTRVLQLLPTTMTAWDWKQPRTMSGCSMWPPPLTRGTSLWLLPGQGGSVGLEPQQGWHWDAQGGGHAARGSMASDNECAIKHLAGGSPWPAIVSAMTPMRKMGMIGSRVWLLEEATPT
jgi:hypothetical protein